jgi:hypothetical protein
MMCQRLAGKNFWCRGRFYALAPMLVEWRGGRRRRTRSHSRGRDRPMVLSIRNPAPDLANRDNDQPGGLGYVPDWTSPSMLDFRLTSPFGLCPFVHCYGVLYREIIVNTAL